NRPTSIWSAVAVLPFATPSDATSASAARYARLGTRGGGPGRNWLALDSANGRTADQCVNWGWRGKLGGVGWESPGALPNVNGLGGAFEPSSVRSAIISAATMRPTVTPSSFALPSGTCASDSCRRPSSRLWNDGYSATRTSWPAAAAAASCDACGDAVVTETAYGACVAAIELTASEMAACIIAKLRVGCSVGGGAPG